MSYSNLCVQPEEIHVCPICPEDLIEEFAGIGQAGFIKEAYLPTLLAAPTTLATWTTGIASGDIIPLPDTRGSYDPGTPKELPGYGRRKFSYGAREMTLNLFEKFNRENLPFYSNIHNRTDLVPYFVTSSLARIFDQAGVITAGDPVSEDIEEVINFSAVAKIVSKKLPAAYPIAAIKTAFNCPVVATTPSFTFSTQPAGKVVPLNTATTLGGGVLTGGTAPYTYRWQKKAGSSYNNVTASGGSINVATATGQLTDTISFSAAKPEVNNNTPFDEGTYRLQVTDSTGAIANSADVVLDVKDSKITFVSQAQGDSGDDGGSGTTGVGVNAGGISSSKYLAFDKINPATGSLSTMTVKVGTATEFVVSAPAEYFATGGKPYICKTSDGVIRAGNFTAGNVTPAAL